RRHSGWRSTRPGGWRSSAPLRATTQSSSSLRASALDAPCRRVSRSWLEFPTKRGGDVNSVTRVTRIRLLAACAAATLMAAPRPSLAQQAGMAGGSAALYTLTAAERSAGRRLLVDGKSRLTAAGAAYDVDPSPAGVVKPAGQWNQVRLVVKGKHVEHWLNGVKMVEYEFGSPDWTAKVKASKFASHPHYGRNATGY